MFHLSFEILSVAFLRKFVLQMSNKKYDRLEKTISSKNYPNYILWGLTISSFLQEIESWVPGPTERSVNHMRGLSKITVGGKITSVLLILSLNQ